MKNKLAKEFLDRLKEIYTVEELEIIERGFTCENRKTSFRVNALKATDREIIEILKDNGFQVKKVDFLKHGYILENGDKNDLWALDIFKQGKIYLQSVSSQIPVDMLDLNDFNKVLDVTAAPGGKTSQTSAILKNTGEITAVDNNQIRIDKLTFTLKKQGCRNVDVIKSDARLLLKKNEEYKEHFDHIIADLPCSAEGKINIHKEKSYGFWAMSVIKKNYHLQKDILKSILPLLKNNGTLIYSTCTLAPEENEAVVHMLLSNFPELQMQEMKLESPYKKAGIPSFGKNVYRKDVTKSIRILPSDETEGFFIAKFKKVKKD